MFDYFYGQSGEMFSYFRVPKILFRDIKFKDLSTDTKTLYGILLDRMGLSVKNGWLDEQGRVYIIFPVQEVMDALGCADNKATKLFRELEKFGLIERKRRGLGKPNLIYVKNFADPRFRNREKNGSGAADSAQQETAKSRGNKTEWNKTEGSEPDPFSSDAESEPDERTRLEAYFMQSLEVDLLLRVCPDEEDTIDQIVNVRIYNYLLRRYRHQCTGRSGYHADSGAGAISFRKRSGTAFADRAEGPAADQPETENRGYPADHDGQPHQLRKANRHADSAGVRQQNPGV